MRQRFSSSRRQPFGGGHGTPHLANVARVQPPRGERAASTSSGDGIHFTCRNSRDVSPVERGFAPIARGFVPSARGFMPSSRGVPVLPVDPAFRDHSNAWRSSSDVIDTVPLLKVRVRSQRSRVILSPFRMCEPLIKDAPLGACRRVQRTGEVLCPPTSAAQRSDRRNGRSIPHRHISPSPLPRPHVQCRQQRTREGGAKFHVMNRYAPACRTIRRDSGAHSLTPWLARDCVPVAVGIVASLSDARRPVFGGKHQPMLRFRAGRPTDATVRPSRVATNRHGLVGEFRLQSPVLDAT